jgi:ferric-dicitrate binding protein FerR (iron transport regulator)
MTDSEEERPEVLDILRAFPVGIASQRESDDARDRIMPWLENQVEALPAARAKAIRAERNRRLQRLTVGTLGLAAAAGAVLYFATTSENFPGGGTTSSRSDSGQTTTASDDFATLISGQVQSGTIDVLEGSRLGLSSQVTTNEHEDARLRGQGGYEVRLGPSSSFAFKGTFPTPPDQIRVRLDAGHAEFSVPKLTPGHSFVVETQGAEIRVVGTTFSVSQTRNPRPCVRVSEGSVAVSNPEESVLLKPGDSWGFESEAPDGSKTTTDVKTSAQSPARANPARATTLAQENALLSRALSEESQGHKDAALQAFRELLRRYPHSPFATDAKAGLKRISQSSP